MDSWAIYNKKIKQVKKITGTSDENILQICRCLIKCQAFFVDIHSVYQNTNLFFLQNNHLNFLMITNQNHDVKSREFKRLSTKNIIHVI